jgi:hypothetical protein
MFIKGYKYNTEQDAKEAVERCNSFYKIPKEQNDVTKNWCNYERANSFYYIVFDESLLSILGEPINIELPNNAS